MRYKFRDKWAYLCDLDIVNLETLRLNAVIVHQALAL